MIINLVNIRRLAALRPNGRAGTPSAHHALRLLSATIAPLAVAAAARAQSEPAKPDAAASAVTLQPVTVKGSRDTQDYRAPSATLGVLGDLRQLDTPFSTSVLTRQLIDNQQAASYGDYLKNDPSASVGNVPVGFASLRGFSIGTDGYLFDGLPGALGLSDGRYQLQGIDRIEVLKGPAAFLYGLGTSTSVGGTLNFVPKKPTDAPVRAVSFGYTSRSLWSANADLGDRFGADRQFGYRLNVGLKEGEQAVQHADWAHRATTLALDWRVAPGLTVSGGFEYAHNHFPSLQPFFVLSPGLPVPQAPRLSNNIAQSWDDFKTIATTAYVRADWKLSSDWSLTAQGLRGTDDRPQTNEARFGFITSAAGDATLFGSQDESESTATTAQLSLRGKLSTGAIAHQLTLAATSTRVEQRSGSGALGAGFNTNLYAPVDNPEPAGVAVPVALTQKTRGSSLLLSDIVKLGEQWSVLGGIRQARLSVDNFNPDGSVANTADVSKSAPFGALIWKPTGESSVYLNYAEGLEQGGRAPVGSTNANQLLAPIVTKQIEFGTKLELDGVTLTAAAFDLRRPFEYLDPTSLAYVQNGVQRHRGVEFTAAGQATRNLAVVAGAMLLNPRTNSTGNPDTEGKVAVGAPRTTANVYLDYRLDAVPGLFVNGGLYYSGRQYLDGANTQAVDGWTRLDLGGRYDTRLGSVQTTLYFGVENVANRNYWSGAQSGILTLAEPRTFKLTARFAL